MGLFKKNTIERDFTGCELFKQVGEYKIYYPTSEERLKRFGELLEKYGNNTKDGIEFNGENAFIDIFELFTNVRMDKERYEKNADKLEFKLRIVLNYVKESMFDVIELLQTEIDTDERQKNLGYDKEQVVKDRNDKNVIQAEFKKKMHDDKEDSEVENDDAIVDQDKVVDDDTKIEELTKQIKEEEKKKQIAELEKKLAELRG